MVDNACHGSRVTNHTRIARRAAYRCLALLLLVGLLAWPTVQGLLAQERPPQPTPPPRDVVETQSAPRPPSAPAPQIPQAPSTNPAPLPPSTLPSVPAPTPQPAPPIATRRFQFKIAPNTPLKDLLPVPPRAKNEPVPVIAKDLSQVPEVEFQLPQGKNLGNEETLKRTAHQIAKINHLNGKDTEGFLEALRGQRQDLAGLPFAMGDACRTNGERSRQFALAVATVRAALQPGGRIPFGVTVTTSANTTSTPLVVNALVPSSQPGGVPAASTPVLPPTQVFQDVIVQTPDRSGSPAADRPAAESFWEQYETACAQEDKKLARVDRTCQEHVTLARIAALMQVLAPESPSIRLRLVKYLSGISHVEATRALARLAIFSSEDDVRNAAVDALKVRRERDYTDILVKSLHYPWPAVAQRGAEAMVKLERTDLVPSLVDVLDGPDPRSPIVKEISGKKTAVVRELVRVNHHRNCLMCHAPANTGNVSPDALTAAVPVPDEPLPLPSEGYRTSSPDVLVRIDVTYLRQDFSAFQAVVDANPWPEMQRFDFLVRTRGLTDKEAEAFREKLTPGEAGRQSPYHRTALAALRELTGKDTEPTPEAWRRLLNLPKEQQRTALLR